MRGRKEFSGSIDDRRAKKEEENIKENGENRRRKQKGRISTERSERSKYTLLDTRYRSALKRQRGEKGCRCYIFSCGEKG
ncbi:hypothetical protein WN48_00608 [Eufriesea mexicana]|uniref:Uncharacterized protein n=1 Tax=Eufriesea mexicana TaxID=516756 RepID=A0A310SCI0_9HYME|nr:hypothetical protein WN48_00608 [Eufriesea mexicana]